MTYKFDSRYIGYPPVEEVSSTQKMPMGLMVEAEDPVWGGAELIYAKANGAIRNLGLCVLTPVFNATTKRYDWNATECPNTANLGRPVYVAMGGAMTSGQFGYFLTTGNVAINGSASVAADTAVGITAAGQIGANTAGKQLLNARGVTAATATVAKTSCTGKNADNKINVPDTQGWFVGGFLSGTGVGAASVITSMDPLGSFVMVSVANTADIAGTVTVTYNNATIFYNVVNLNRVQAQGPIT